ncbi:MAG: SDR family oxidoreductase [Anaerolineales bacterium]|nr:SDR family oxidoreductase [Anaerolineales bacterium]
MKLKDTGVFITGASKGIGRAIAQTLLREGASVFLAARSERLLSEFCDSCPQTEGKTFYGRMDLLDAASIRVCVAEAIHSLGTIDILINNAGITSQDFLVNQEPEQAALEIQVNYLGMYRVTQTVLPHMLAKGKGMIVNVASTIGKVPSPTQANYSATKAAVIAFSEALRGEVEDHGIRVKIFIPGHTRTEMVRSIKMDSPQTMTPEEVAFHMVRAIRSPKAEYICGGMNEGIIRLHRFFPELARKIMKDISVASYLKPSTAPEPRK